MAALCILGGIYHWEKALFGDGVYYLFTIVNEQKFAIMHQRYGMFIAELLPYLGQKLHLPLRTVAFLFGSGFYFTYFIAHLFIVYGLKQYRLGIIMALFYTMLVTQSFFFMSEVQVGGMWMFVLLALTLRMGELRHSIWLLLPPFIILALFAFTSHFTTTIPTFFLWIYFIIEGSHWPWSRRHTILLSAVLVLCFFAKFIQTAFVGGNTDYDTHNLEGITHPSLIDILQFYKKSVVHMFFGRCLSMYWISTFAFILGVATLLKQRLKLLATWSVLSWAGYCLLVGLALGYNDESFSLFHAECEWLCLGAIMATPFVCAYLQSNTGERYVTWLLIIVFAIRLIYISTSAAKFQRSIAFQHNIVKKMKAKNIRKLALYRDRAVDDIIMLDWVTTYTSIILSQIDGEKPQRYFTFIDPDKENEKHRVEKARGMDIFWLDMPPVSFNKQYFSIDTGSYLIMTYDEFVQYPAKEQ